jgi:uncharacterized protein YjiS (DUF1127 family)
MLQKGKSKAATRSLASGTRGPLGAVWAAATRHARALVRAILRDLAWGRTVRALRERGDETRRDIGVTRDQIPALVRHLLDESGLGKAATQARETPSVRRTWVDVPGSLTAALLRDPGPLPPTGGEREAERADSAEPAGMVHRSRMGA